MQDHAIPQDVTGYRFHIVGNMTLGQFTQLAVGAVICFLIYQTNLYDIVRYPLILLVAGVAAVATFIPIADRPLLSWVTTFFRILYKPTQYFWIRTPVLPDFFLFQPNTNTPPMEDEPNFTPVRRQRIREYITSTAHLVNDPEKQQLDAYFHYVFDMFAEAPDSTIRHDVATKPSLKVRVRSMRSSTQLHGRPDTPASADFPSDTDRSSAATKAAVFIPGGAPPGAPTLTIPQAAAMVDTTIPLEVMPIIGSAELETAKADAQSLEVDRKDGLNQLVDQSAAHIDEVVATKTATTNVRLPFPSRPTIPNKLVGMVVTTQNTIVEGAIVEIHSAQGATERVVRTNALGQFFITTPLKNSSYTLVTEKSGLRFEPVSIEAKGKIIDPVEIRAS